MPAPKNNNYWTFREKHGRNHEYTPEGLWKEAVKYFIWVKENPLKEQKVFAFQGKITKTNVNKMRAMTKVAFCLFADICETTFDNYAKHEDFMGIVTRIKKIIYSQKFEGAAADLLNPNIIARDLGLKDKSVVENINEKPIVLEISNEAQKELDQLLNEDN